MCLNRPQEEKKKLSFEWVSMGDCVYGANPHFPYPSIHYFYCPMSQTFEPHERKHERCDELVAVAEGILGQRVSGEGFVAEALGSVYLKGGVEGDSGVSSGAKGNLG